MSSQTAEGFHVQVTHNILHTYIGQKLFFVFFYLMLSRVKYIIPDIIIFLTPSAFKLAWLQTISRKRVRYLHSLFCYVLVMVCEDSALIIKLLL